MQSVPESSDARSPADALRIDRRFLHGLKPDTADAVQLRDRTRIVNWLRRQLWRYFPQFLKVACGLTQAWVPEPRKLAPTSDKARRLRTATVETFLERRRPRAIGAPDVPKRSRKPAITAAPGVAGQSG